MADDSNVQSIYDKGKGGDHSDATKAGRWQADNNPGYTPPQQSNESWDTYQTRINSQRG
jgi:hypothetical protein